MQYIVYRSYTFITVKSGIKYPDCMVSWDLWRFPPPMKKAVFRLRCGRQTKVSARSINVIGFPCCNTSAVNKAKKSKCFL